jgi:predicted nucleic acid-binding protein
VTLVVDASVALKWFLADEPDADRALAVLRGGGVLVAPDIILAEVCNAAWRSARLGRIARNQVKEIANALPRFFDRIAGSATLIARAVEIADQLDHPVYDSLYLSLAEMEQANVITADLHLIGKIRGTPWKNRAVPLAGYTAPAG